MGFPDSPSVQFVDPIEAQRRRAEEAHVVNQAQPLLAAARTKKPRSSSSAADAILSDLYRDARVSLANRGAASDAAATEAVIAEAKQLVERYTAGAPQRAASEDAYNSEATEREGDPAAPPRISEHLIANAEGYVNASHPGQADPGPDFSLRNEAEKDLDKALGMNMVSMYFHGGPAGAMAKQNGMAQRVQLRQGIAVRDYARTNPAGAARYLPQAPPTILNDKQAAFDPAGKKLFENREKPPLSHVNLTDSQMESAGRSLGKAVIGGSYDPASGLTKYQFAQDKKTVETTPEDVPANSPAMMTDYLQGAADFPGVVEQTPMIRDYSQGATYADVMEDRPFVEPPGRQLAPHYTEVVDPKTGNKAIVSVDAQGKRVVTDTGGKYHTTASDRGFKPEILTDDQGNAFWADPNKKDVTAVPGGKKFHKPGTGAADKRADLAEKEAIKKTLAAARYDPKRPLAPVVVTDAEVEAVLEGRRAQSEPNGTAPQDGPAPAAGAPAPAPTAGVRPRRVFNETTQRTEPR